MRFWLSITALAMLSGCALTVSDPRALKPIDSFVPLAGDSRIWVEPGFEAYGERVAEALPAGHRQGRGGALPAVRPRRRASMCAAATPVSSAMC